jgi:hypothetical protein
VSEEYFVFLFLCLPERGPIGSARPHIYRDRLRNALRALRTRAHWRYGTNAVQVACWQPTAGPKRDVPTLDLCSLKIAVRVTLSRFTASLWIAVQVSQVYFVFVFVFVSKRDHSRQLDAQCRASSAPLRDLLDAPTALAACCGFDMCPSIFCICFFCICISWMRDVDGDNSFSWLREQPRPPRWMFACMCKQGWLSYKHQTYYTDTLMQQKMNNDQQYPHALNQANEPAEAHRTRSAITTPWSSLLEISAVASTSRTCPSAAAAAPSARSSRAARALSGSVVILRVSATGSSPNDGAPSRGLLGEAA